jgi:hypothetical protein
LLRLVSLHLILGSASHPCFLSTSPRDTTSCQDTNVHLPFLSLERNFGPQTFLVSICFHQYLHCSFPFKIQLEKDEDIFAPCLSLFEHVWLFPRSGPFLFFIFLVEESFSLLFV